MLPHGNCIMAPMNHRLMRPTRKGPKVPGAPTITSSIYTGGNGRITTTWSAPASNGGSAITLYRIYYSAETIVPVQAVGSASSAYFEPIVDPSGGEIVQVAAVNAVGEGPKSAPFPVTV